MAYYPPSNDRTYSTIQIKVELKNHARLIRQNANAIRKIENRMAKVEAVLDVYREERKSRRRASDGIIEAMRNYWKLLAIMATFITFIITHFLRNKIG